MEKPIVINIPPVNTWTLTDLKGCCKRNKVKGYTRMNKEQLIDAVENVIRNIKTKH